MLDIILMATQCDLELRVSIPFPPFPGLRLTSWGPGEDFQFWEVEKVEYDLSSKETRCYVRLEAGPAIEEQFASGVLNESRHVSAIAVEHGFSEWVRDFEE